VATLGRSPRQGSAHPPSEELDVDIDEMSVEGDGVARVGRRTFYVPFTIPGERVRVVVRGGPRAAAQGSLVSVLRASPQRVSPRCRHFGPCGGCAWQHIAYPEQLRIKTALLDRLVRGRVPAAPRALAMLTAHAAEPWGFRQKVHFVFGEGGGRRGSRDLLMGHYARGSRGIVGVSECPVHDARGNALAFALHEQLARARIQADAGQGASLQSIAIRSAVGTDELSATLVVSHEGDKRLRTATRKVMDLAPAGTAFHLNVHDEDDGFIFGDRTRKLAGADRLREKVGIDGG